MGKLTAVAVRAAKSAGRYQDGNGLMLLVKESGARSWLLRMQVDGKRRDFGLGSAADVTLAEARERATETRKQVRLGIDPVAAKRASRAFKAAIPTFEEAAALAHGDHKAGWRNDKHKAQWLSTLKAYAHPHIGNLPVDQIDAGAIGSALLPIWLTKPETARRVRQRITAVLDWAHGKGFRPTEAPTRSVGKLLPRQPASKGHFPAMPFVEVPAFMRELADATQTVGRQALRFLIFTAARSGEVRGATWGEIDLNEALWTVPAERMKAGRKHVVPLAKPVLELLRSLQPASASKPHALIFPGHATKPLSDMTLTKVLRTARGPRETVHGFRSSFRDWAAEHSSASVEVIETALAHTIPNKTEAAYRRTIFLEKRRNLMDEWANYLLSRPTSAT